MLDIKIIRQDPDLFDKSMQSRGCEYRSDKLLQLDEKRRSMQTDIQELQSLRNNLAKKVGIAKKNGVVTAGQPAPALTPNDTIFSFLLELESAPKITVVRSNEDKVNIVALINAFI